MKLGSIGITNPADQFVQAGNSRGERRAKLEREGRDGHGTLSLRLAGKGKGKNEELLAEMVPDAHHPILPIL